MSEAAPSESDILSMSDEDILNMNGPPEVAEPIGSNEDDLNVTDAELNLNPDPVVKPVAEPAVTDARAVLTSDPDADENIGDKPPVVPPVVQTDKSGSLAEPKADVNAVGAEPKIEQVEATPPTPEEYKTFYEKIMTPFKANGKMIELRSEQEAIQLMQMGANYTRKLQDIQPHRKTLLMLENNGLLGDEGKLSFLIDLDKKDPEAIKKLMKDSGIDPLDMDLSVEPAYLEGNHRVTDEEASFRQTINDLTVDEAGKETISLINSQWDASSKEVLWKSPEIMTVIHAQRETGVYDLIVDEMDRQKTLGKITANTPFLQAYKTVGDELAAANGFAHIVGTQAVTNPSDTSAGKPEPVAVATRTATPKSQVANEDKASAASSTRGTPKPAKVLVNPLAMSDDEFLKEFNQRL